MTRELEQAEPLGGPARRSEELFRAAFEQSPMSTQILSPDGKTIWVNRAWERLWGVTLEDLGDYNMLEDPQLEAKGIAPLLRRVFAGEAAEVSEHVQWGVVLGDAETGRLLTMNPAYARMHGYEVEELSGRLIADVFAP